MLRSSIFRSALAFAAAATLYACGGAGGGSSSPSAAPVLPTQTTASFGKATLSFAIPARALAADRRTQYLSSATQSVSVTVTAGGASPSPAVVANVTPSSPNCSPTSAGTTCNVTVAAPIGTDAFAVAMYAGLNGTGSILSSATVSGAVSGGIANAIPIALGGVPASIVVTLPPTPAQAGTPSTLPVTVTVRDASGATIVGNDPFANPITLTDSDSSGGTSLSTTTFANPSTAVTFNYNGTYVPYQVSVSASAAGVAAAATTPAAFYNTAGHIYVGDHQSPNVFVVAAQASGTVTPKAFESQHVSTLLQDGTDVVAGLTINQNGNAYVLYNLFDPQYPNGASEIAEFSPGVAAASAGTGIAPTGTLAGAATLLDAGSSDIAVDGAGHVYVDGTAGTQSILVFPFVNGNVAPLYQIPGNAGGIAVTAGGTLVASIDHVSSGTPADLDVFAPGATTPKATLTNAGTGIVALDASGNVYARTGTTPNLAVGEFALAGTMLTSIRSITNTAFTSPQPVAVDQAGYIYVANEAQNGQIFVFAPTATGAATPLRTITSTTPWIPGTLAVGP